jgi:hypothetical protein
MINWESLKTYNIHVNLSFETQESSSHGLKFTAIILFIKEWLETTTSTQFLLMLILMHIMHRKYKINIKGSNEESTPFAEFHVFIIYQKSPHK